MIPSNNKIKLLIVGFYGAYNIGDDLMLKSLLSFLDEDVFEITVMFNHNADLILEDFEHVNVIYYPKNVDEYIVYAKKFDKLIFGGGAIIDDTNFDIKQAYQYDLGTIFVNLSSEFIFQKK